MLYFELITIIVVVSIVASVFKTYLKKNQHPKVDLSNIEARLEKLEALQQRIEVLEAIVTDKNYDLKSKIDQLK